MINYILKIQLLCGIAMIGLPFPLLIFGIDQTTLELLYMQMLFLYWGPMSIIIFFSPLAASNEKC